VRDVAVRVVLINPSLASYAPGLMERVSPPIEVRVPRTFHDEDVLPLLPEAEIALTSYWYPAWGRAAQRLRFIQMPGAGWDKMDAAAIPDGVLVANCYEHERAIAEYVMMVCLALSRELLPADRALRRNDWSYFSDAGHPLYPELGGRTIGLVGLGRIGRAVARLAAAFDLRRVGLDQVPIPEAARSALGLDWVGGPADLGRLLGESDFVVLAVPLNDQTRGLLGTRELRRLKPSAYLINPARASLVDEQALYEALRDRWFAGAALDPWWSYPKADESVAPSRFPFGALDNVIMTPHSSGTTIETIDRRMRAVADNLNRFLRGEPVLNVVPELSRWRPSGAAGPDGLPAET
jgi:phosphoglycerate dehydrogenase-like enzyme